ncbi:MAG: hypothetical protein EBR02_05335 [Alphaproteobacteria bacterium]|nr:hypothetical protein [Alphaproteobacteria bacterium]
MSVTSIAARKSALDLHIKISIARRDEKSVTEKLRGEMKELETRKPVTKAEIESAKISKDPYDYTLVLKRISSDVGMQKAEENLVKASYENLSPAYKTKDLEKAYKVYFDKYSPTTEFPTLARVATPSSTTLTKTEVSQKC